MRNPAPPAAFTNQLTVRWIIFGGGALVLILLALKGYKLAVGAKSDLHSSAPAEDTSSPPARNSASTPADTSVSARSGLCGQASAAGRAPIIPASSASIPPWVEKCDFGPAHMRFELGSPLGKSYAQHHEDVTAHERYFWGVKGGTFLEIGALDGLDISTSLMLEESAGWRSVLIEASPGQFSRCARNRPAALTLNFAACSQPRKIHYLDSDAIATGMGAGGGIIEFMPSRMMRNNFGSVPELLAQLDLSGDEHGPVRITNAAALEALHYIKTVSDQDGECIIETLCWERPGRCLLPLLWGPWRVKVRCEPISPVLLSYGVDHISMWVLDVEGAELEVLQVCGSRG
jgi:hypothetical protein